MREKEQAQPPVLSTENVCSIRPTRAICGGFITDDGGLPVTARGVCWSNLPHPAITDNKTVDGKGTGMFKSAITGLTSMTVYYVRAYATNSIATSYGNELLFRTCADTVSDADSNVYNTMKIGNQMWMAENLKTTKYNDRTPIPPVPDIGSWTSLSTPGYCWFNNDTINCKITYGALYNWYTVDMAGNGGKNLCPTGWHVPTDSEWTTLITFLGGADVAGGKMKETGTIHWQSPNTGATDESGFTGLPGGGRYYYGTFSGIGNIGGWWSSTELESFPRNARGQFLYFNYSHVYSGSGSKNDGFSVRCIKD